MLILFMSTVVVMGLIKQLTGNDGLIMLLENDGCCGMTTMEEASLLLLLFAFVLVLLL